MVHVFYRGYRKPITQWRVTLCQSVSAAGLFTLVNPGPGENAQSRPLQNQSVQSIGSVCCVAWAVCGVVPVHAAAGRRPKARSARCGRRRCGCARAAAAAAAGAGGARVSGVQRAPRTPAPQCRAGARHARPAPIPRRLTAWPTRPPPSHAATLWRRYASVIVFWKTWPQPAAYRRNPPSTLHATPDQWQCYRSPVTQWGSVSAEVSSRFDRPQTERSRREWSPRAPLDGAGSRSCGERSPPAPRRRRRRLLFRAVRVHKIIIGRPVVSTAARRRAVADVSGARARAPADGPASPTFHHRRLRLARHTTLTRQALH